MEQNTLDVDALSAELTDITASAASRDSLNAIKREWLSKEGKVKALFKQLKDVAPDARPAVAARCNEIKESIEAFVAKREAELAEEEGSTNLRKEFFDLTLPGRLTGPGTIHPLTRVERTIASILRQCGFQNYTGPIVETEYYCFDALNIPKHHPARDMQDTFYTDTGHVLRTHTTSVQARLLEKGGLPLRAMSIGQVYRNEAEDAGHTSMFHQFELVWVDQGLTLSHLMALITHILKELYGKRRKVRFVPKFYPYTEPSIGAEVDCVICKSQGCGACGGSGWVTIVGAGMIHRNVLTEFKIDPEKMSGFAFGFGTTRLAAQILNLDDVRKLYENDLRVLKEMA